MRLSTLALGFISTLAVASLAGAATPTAISVQGVLRDAMGKFQTVPVDLKVVFYDAQTGGNMLAGPYNKSSVPVANGLFSVQIDEATLASKLAATATGQIWMEVTAGTSDVYPRQPVTSQIFALQAANADNLGGRPPSSFLASAAATVSIPATNWPSGATGAWTTIPGTSAQLAARGKGFFFILFTGSMSAQFTSNATVCHNLGLNDQTASVNTRTAGFANYCFSSGQLGTTANAATPATVSLVIPTAANDTSTHTFVLETFDGSATGSVVGLLQAMWFPSP